MKLDKIIPVLFLLLLSSVYVSGQRQYILNEDKTKLSLIIDLKKIKLTLDNNMVGRRGDPFPEARLYNLNVNMDTIGRWKSLKNGSNTWIMEIEAPEAKGFFISFNDFYLPEGSLLYVYNRDNHKDAVVYSHKNNPWGGPYSIENLAGDNVVLEYLKGPSVIENPILEFRDLGYKYITGLDNELPGFDLLSNTCMPNIDCSVGEYWQNQKKGVLRIRVNRNDGSSLCSGTLINNVNNDKTPYVLSAEHCFPNMTAQEIANTEFYFEYESPTCTPVTLPTYKYHKGAEMLVISPMKGGSDVALLKLSAPIPEDWDVYYNGWDLNNDGNSITSGSVVHHPMGDVKKITLYSKPLVSGKWSEDDPTAADGTHWLINYTTGATSGGSSGSPIFNQNGLVVGTLSGGSSSCTVLNGMDYFGKLWYHWDQSPDPARHVKKYLDPGNTGITKLAGLSVFGGENPNPEQQPDVTYYIDGNNMRVYAKDIIRKIRVMNLTGYTVYLKDEGFSSSVEDIPIGNWRGGVYVLSVDMEGRSTKSIKIIK